MTEKPRWGEELAGTQPTQGNQRWNGKPRLEAELQRNQQR
nr:hypothetical protein [Kibdelosporangium sp. MJ126-NF4]CTQ97034.1 hypothetical protein [Kibdelosporangium sp. MJ126-NF4]